MTIEEIVQQANDLQHVLTGEFSQIREMVDSHDVVLGVWRDLKAKDGVGVMIVKGQRVLMDIVSTDVPRGLTWTAIPCIGIEQAVALKEVAGEAKLA